MPLAGGGVHGPLAEVPGVLHTPVARGVDLYHVQVGGAAPHPGAVLALTAGIARGVAIRAVERHGENAGRGGLTHPPRPGEQVPVTDAAPSDGSAQHRGDVVLDQKVGETFGTVTASEGDGHAMVMGGGKEKCLRLPEATPGIA